MRTLALIVALIPSVALAQPAPSSEPAPPPPPPSSGAPVYPPPAPGYPPPAPAPAYAPPPQPGYQPAYAMPADPLAFHRGVTFEANIGVGFAHLSDASTGTTTGSINSDTNLAGLDLGIGGWLNPNLALTFRIAGVDVSINGQSASNGTVVNAFFGPSLQYWTDSHLWFGGGAGFSTFRLVGGNCTSNGSSDMCGINGFGLDMRAGYSFGDTANTFNVSLEVNPGFYSQNGTSATATSIGFLAGYQYL